MNAALLERPTDKPVEPGRSQFYSDFGFTRHVVQDSDDVKAAGIKLPGAASPQPQKGDLILEGYASTWVMDRDFEFILRSAYDKTLESYLRKNPIVLWQHNHDWPLGQIGFGDTDDTGLAVRAFVRKPEAGEEAWRLTAYNDIKAGIVRTFSVGGWFTREFVEGEIFVTQVDLFEISVVSVPSNPDSIFEAGVKALKGLPMRTHTSKAVAQMEQLLGLAPVTDPALITLGETDKLATYHRLAADLASTKGQAVPGFNDWRELTAALPNAKPEEAPALAAKAESIVTALYGPGAVPGTPGEKAGRVLSKGNESKLRSAAEKVAGAAEDIRAVLDKLPSQDEDAS